jgi:hypothetical protein
MGVYYNVVADSRRGGSIVKYILDNKNAKDIDK